MRLKIRNWVEFQHYKNRNPPWIKLHFKLLSSKDWVNSSDCMRVLAVACMLIASQDDANDGSFEADPEYFQRVAYLNKKPDFNPLITNGFLEMLADASKCLQTLANACASREEEKEEETEKEKRREEGSVRGETTPFSPVKKTGSNQLSDSEWIEGLKQNPAYRGLDIEVLNGKMLAWCELNGKKPTRKRLLNWLNREERPMTAPEVKKPQPKPKEPPPDPRDQWQIGPEEAKRILAELKK